MIRQRIAEELTVAAFLVGFVGVSLRVAIEDAAKRVLGLPESFTVTAYDEMVGRIAELEDELASTAGFAP